jgi:uncharacterized membrane protein YagU involved in acid resistance
MANPNLASASVLKPGWAALVAAGLSCGVLDIAAAFAHAWSANGMPPGRVLQAVASGLMGADAFKGGAGMMALGLALHFLISFFWAAIFWALSWRFGILRQQAVISGLFFGAFVYIAMTYAVLPLAAEARALYIPSTKPFVPRWGWAQFGIHLIFVGLAISLAVKHWSPKRA